MCSLKKLLGTASAGSSMIRVALQLHLNLRSLSLCCVLLPLGDLADLLFCVRRSFYLCSIVSVDVSIHHDGRLDPRVLILCTGSQAVPQWLLRSPLLPEGDPPHHGAEFNVVCASKPEVRGSQHAVLLQSAPYLQECLPWLMRDEAESILSALWCYVSLALGKSVSLSGQGNGVNGFVQLAWGAKETAGRDSSC